MKVLYLPLQNLIRKQSGTIDGFIDCGVDLMVFDFYGKFLNKVPVKNIRRELVKVAAGFQPDLLHMQLQFTNVIDTATLIEIKKACPNVIMTNWTGDIRSNVPNIFVETAKVVNISLISSVGQLEMYKKAAGSKVRVEYWQAGFNPKWYFPKNNKQFKYDMVFAGSYGRPSGFPGEMDRRQAVELLKKNFGDKFGLFGSGWPKYKVKHIDQMYINDIYNNSASCLSISNFNDVSHYFSNRLLLCMASGRPTVSLTFPGWDSYFTDNYDIIMAKTVDEIPEKVRWVLNNSKEATKIGEAGARTVLAEHSNYSRNKQLLHMVGLL